jgi:hypothetical protein
MAGEKKSATMHLAGVFENVHNHLKPTKYFFMKKIYLMVLLAFSAGQIIMAQCTDVIPLTTMFVDKNTNNQRAAEFLTAIPSKYEKLSAVNGKQDIVINYTQKAMEKLFKAINTTDGDDSGIRVYFARYNACLDNALPDPVKENQLIVLFTKEVKKSAPRNYFFINANDDALYYVDSVCAEKWIRDFIKKNQPGLRTTINDVPENADATSPVGYSDTKSIFFRKGQIDSSFNKEEEYQLRKHGIRIKGYQLLFSAYSNEGDERGRHKNRLHIQFNYLYDREGKTEILFLDDQEDYGCRREASEKAVQIAAPKKMLINNGQLCPTHCPPKPPTGG